ncbi:MAG: hypothetical protein J3K34DRAFT_522411 [Monoraphidium minutum]|nr:MAG: hypothetical protein J3K34DRAFT_522411 [Monoraphidium minutum]
MAPGVGAPLRFALLCLLAIPQAALGDVIEPYDPAPAAPRASAPLPPRDDAARAAPSLSPAAPAPPQPPPPPPPPPSLVMGLAGMKGLNLSDLRSRLQPLDRARNRTREARLRRQADEWRLTPEQARRIGKPWAEGMIRICVAHIRPDVLCLDRLPELYSGYQVEVFRAVARSLFWLGDDRTSWFFDCTSWEELLADISSPNGTCLMAPAGLTPDGAPRLSWVIDKSGFKTLVLKDTIMDLHLFTPFEALSPTLWLALAGTAAAVGAAVWLCDAAGAALDRAAAAEAAAGSGGGGGAKAAPRARAAAGEKGGSGGEMRHTENGGGGGGMDGSTWDDAEAARGPGGGASGAAGPFAAPAAQEPAAAGNCFLRWLGVRQGEEPEAMRQLGNHMQRAFLKFADMGDGPKSRSLPAQIILFTYGVLIILIIALCTAGTAARLTTMQVNGNILGREDLPGKVVGTWEGYVGRLADHGITAVGMPWLNGANEEAMLRHLRGGEIQALVLDADVVDYLASTQCDLVAVGAPFSIVDVGIGLALEMPRDLEADLNSVIRDDIRKGIIERLRDAHVMRAAGAASCGRGAAGMDSTITLPQVAGLWVMLAIGVLIASLVLCASSARRADQADPAPAAAAMGKGGTKFEGDAIGVRGKVKAGLTGKEMRRNMEKFLETGVHPEIERAQREADGDTGYVTLPDHDQHRPFVFWDIAIDNKPAGRLVIELYEDLHPIGANHLRNRCLPGATASLHGATFHRLLRHYAVFAGKSAAAAAPALRPSKYLRNSDLGAVSVSNDGTEVGLALARSLTLDATHQVVGRVHLGREALEALNGLSTTPDDAPIQRVKIVKCGATNHKGTHDTLDESAAKETAAEAAERLQQESRDTKASILDALQEGMRGAKRKAPDAGAAAGGSGAGASTSGGGGGGGTAAAAAAARSVRARGGMDPLAGLSSGDDDGDDDDESAEADE